MLVSQNIVNRWYNKNHWIYKQFAYLFKNPMWNKNIPSGFSVCPYFWLALFSAFLFKPFFIFPLYGLTRLLRPIFSKANEIAAGVVLTFAVAAIIFLAYSIYDTFGVFYPLTAASVIVSFIYAHDKNRTYKWEHKKNSWVLGLPTAIFLVASTALYFVDNLEFGKLLAGYKDLVLLIPLALKAIFTFEAFSVPLMPTAIILGCILSCLSYVFGKISHYLTESKYQKELAMSVEEYNKIYCLDLFPEMVREYATEHFQSLPDANKDELTNRVMEVFSKKLPANWIKLISRKIQVQFDPNQYVLAIDRLRHDLMNKGETEDEKTLGRLIYDIKNSPEIATIFSEYYRLHAERLVFMAQKQRKNSKFIEWIEVKYDAMNAKISPLWLELMTCKDYIFTLIKARKQGWCPYIRFEDKNSNKE